MLRYGALPVDARAADGADGLADAGRGLPPRRGWPPGSSASALVVLYMILYYRVLGVVVLVGMIIWAALNFAVISWLGQTRGLALSLAGVTGLVVSVGVTVDSYVVYFERLKDDLRLGRPPARGDGAQLEASASGPSSPPTSPA